MKIEDKDPKRCDDPAPHDAHRWHEERENWWWDCEGRRAHANVMIGRNG